MALVPALAAEFRWTQVSRIRLHLTPAPQTPLQGVLPSPPSPNRFACILLSSLFFACPPRPKRPATPSSQGPFRRTRFTGWSASTRRRYERAALRWPLDGQRFENHPCSLYSSSECAVDQCSYFSSSSSSFLRILDVPFEALRWGRKGVRWGAAAACRCRRGRSRVQAAASACPSCFGACR